LIAGGEETLLDFLTIRLFVDEDKTPPSMPIFSNAPRVWRAPRGTPTDHSVPAPYLTSAAVAP
jgi:hypothetical protein